MTILDAICEVLKDSTSPQSAKALHNYIVAKGIFAFGAKDPIAIVRATIRRHLRESQAGKGAARVKEVGKDLFSLV